MVLKYTIAWIPMVFIAIANGVLRQYGYGRWMKELSVHIGIFVGGFNVLDGPKDKQNV
ncbi:MAG: hypothetical protein ABF291_03115 [Desulfobacterales bacterium]